MTLSHGLTRGPGSVILSLMLASTASAYTGQDPVITYRSCSFTQVTAQLGPDGSIKYNVMGTCDGSPITGQLAYGLNQQMKEQFIFGGSEIRSVAVCPADPWTTGAACRDQQVSAKGADPGRLVHSPVPLSRAVTGAAEIFQTARANAALPKPPGAPVNPQAVIRSSNRAAVSWLGPDQQGNNGPYLNFIVEARPLRAEGAAWITLGNLPRHNAPDYRLTVQLPPPVKGTEGWELRTCSTTALTRTCTGPFTAALSPVIIDQRAANKNIVRKMPGSLITSGALSQQAVSPQASAPPLAQPPSPGQTSALNPQPLPPKGLPGLIQSPAPGQASALNPQPLPPKTLVAPALRPSIMRRGVPQENATPAKTEPTEAPAP